jgi:hypothetical protein
MTRLRLFSAAHRPYSIAAASYIQPLQAGKAHATIDLGFAGDDTGDHISHKNKNFCELTVLYWIWKNWPRDRVDAWGMVHYRRQFCLHPGWRKKDIYTFSGEQLQEVVSEKLGEKIISSLERKDVILPRPVNIFKKDGKLRSIEEHYRHEHIGAHWDTMISVMKEKYPEYEASLSYFNNVKLSLFNMMIARWSTWDEYLSWLFDILFEVEKRIGPIEDPYQARVFGFLSERMINLFVYHKKYKIDYYPVALFP